MSWCPDCDCWTIELGRQAGALGGQPIHDQSPNRDGASRALLPALPLAQKAAPQPDTLAHPTFLKSQSFHTCFATRLPKSDST